VPPTSTPPPLISAITIPGRIEAENYKAGGEGIGYHDVAIVVIGETPYAEARGDRPGSPSAPLRAGLGLDAEDRETIERVGQSGVPMVVILVSGRPLIVASELADWHAFIAAWLPGTEGQGVVDVLFGDYNFTGTLPLSWPRSEAQIPINVGDPVYDPLFPYGFGLRYP
jgi:beta-glucosidase